MRVLIAEDDPVIALGLVERVGALGHDPLGPARDGAEAVGLARRLEPDLYVFDIDMPRLDGLEAAAELARAGLRRPVVIVTGVDDAELVERSVAAGVFAYLMKPIDERQLGAAIRLADARHRELRALEGEVDRVQQALEDRKLLERAKGLLMAGLGLSEPEAFSRIQRSARDQNLKLAEVARRIIEQRALLEGARAGGSSTLPVE